MHEDDVDPFGTYDVVVNDEEQYSIWPAEKERPQGWRAAGKQGSKAECLAYIGEVWTDMRPRSLRARMEASARNPAPPPPAEPDPLPPLVDRLSEGDHPVVFVCRPQPTARALQERLDLGFVHVKFTGTRGGTELGLRIDRSASDWSQADFEKGTGVVRLAGTLTLDEEPVRCLAAIDVSTLEGTGHLERVPDAAMTTPS